MQHERTYIFFCWPIYVNLYNPEDVRICKSLDMCRRCVGNFVAYLMNILYLCNRFNPQKHIIKKRT